VPTPNASGAARPAAPTASATLKAIAMVGAMTDSERPTASISPRLRRSRTIGVAPAGSLPSLDRARRLRDLPQREFLDLPRRRLRQLLEHEIARYFVTRHVLAAEQPQFLGGHLGAGPELDKGARCLTPFRVGLRDYRHAQHGRMAVQRLLHFDRGNVLPARDDDVLRPIADFRVTVRLHHREVAG